MRYVSNLVYRHIFARLLRHWMKFCKHWIDKSSCQNLIWLTSSARTFISILISKWNVSFIQLLTHSIIKIFRQPCSWNILRKVGIKNILQFSSSWLTYACQLSYSDTQLFFPKAHLLTTCFCWKYFQHFCCAFLFLPDLSNIFPHVHKIRQLCYITRSCGKPDVLFVITCELSNVANISCVIFQRKF